MVDDSKLLESEIIISRGFMLSTQELFGGSYLAIVRNFVHRHGPEIVNSFLRNLDTEDLDDSEKIQRLLKALVAADDVKVTVDDATVFVEVINCRHHIGNEYKKKIGLEEPLVCPVGILSIMSIREILKRDVPGGKKDPSQWDSKGYCSIRFNTKGR